MTDLVVDGLTDREFSVEELTVAMNVVPNMYDAITRFGIFRDPIPLTTTYVRLDINNGVLNLLPTTERGGPASKGAIGKRAAKIFEIPHIAHEDAVMAADIQNLRAFGSRAPMMLEDKVNEKLVTMAMKHYFTHEYMRMGALHGKVVDADGTVLVDYFNEFGITEQVQYFGDTTKSIRAHCIAVKRHIEDNLLGESMTGVACLCSADFFDMLLEDADVKAAYNAAAAMMRTNPNLDDVRPMFPYQGILFMEYRAKGSYLNQDGTTSTRKFIADGEARFFPLGTMDTAHFFVAPGDFLEAANMPGQLFYAKQEPIKFGRGIELHTQSNPLPVWKRPALLVKGTTAAE